MIAQEKALHIDIPVKLAEVKVVFLSILTLAVGAYATGLLVDHGIAARSVAIGIGLVMLIPAALWSWAMQLWASSCAGIKRISVRLR